MTEDRIPPELEDDLRALREEPRPEFARELDRRAAERISRGSLPFRMRGWMPAAVGAAAAAAIAIVIVSGSGGGGGGGHALDVAVVPDGGGLSASRGAGGEAAKDQSAAPAPSAEAAPGQTAAPEATRRAAKPPAPLSLQNASVAAGRPLLVRYNALEGGEAEVSIAGRTAKVSIPPGSGALRVGTRGLPAGAQQLRVELRRAALRVQVTIR